MNQAHDDGQTNGATVRVAVGITVVAAIVGASLWTNEGEPPPAAAPPKMPAVLRYGPTTSRAVTPVSRQAPMAAVSPPAPAQVAPTTFGAITGCVVWKGPAPKLKEIDLRGRERCLVDGAPPVTEEHTIIGDDAGFCWAAVATGDCVIEATHEKWAKLTVKCTVAPNAVVDVMITFEDNN